MLVVGHAAFINIDCPWFPCSSRAISLAGVFTVCACFLFASKIAYIDTMADALKQAEQGEVQETHSTSSIEGSNEKADINKVDLDRIGEEDGYVLDEDTLKKSLGLPASAVLKKAKDGKTVLIPQPTWVHESCMDFRVY